jgi:mono/diheme cytochrome c family protein
MRRAFVALLALANAFAVSGEALAADPAEGRALAERWCAQCHAVAADQPAAADAAPTFPELARARSDEQLAGWMAAPHPPMPDPGLSRAQTAALTAWIASLRN